MELRKVFDTIPEQFDRYRLRYSPALFADLIAFAGVGPGRAVLELGPGTGQATDPILDTGCDYHAIELGEHLCAMMKRKYGRRANFDIVNDDFITHDFGGARFDLIYSAATIQWIPEAVAFSKTFELLKPGGTLAMLLTSRTPTAASATRTRLTTATWTLRSANTPARACSPPSSTSPSATRTATTSSSRSRQRAGSLTACGTPCWRRATGSCSTTPT